MPILRITSIDLVQVCARCTSERTHPLASLVVGHVVERIGGDPHVNPNVVRLPRCDCGAVEELHRTTDALPSKHHGTHFDKHRRAVNRLHVHLADANQLHKHKAFREAHKAHTATPSADVAHNLEIEIGHENAPGIPPAAAPDA